MATLVSSANKKNQPKVVTDNSPHIGAPLWSWLVMAETRSEYYCPPALEVTNEEFYEELQNQLALNRVPAEAKLVEVDWDESGTLQTRTLVRYTGTDDANDIVQLLVGVDRVGRFAYVEKKTLIHPPVLSAKPRKRKDSNGGLAIILIFGLGIVGMGLIFAFEAYDPVEILSGIFAILVGIAISWRCVTKIAFVTKWNNASVREKLAWDKGWEDWLEMRLRAAYLRMTNDVFGRFIDAASSSTDQVVTKLFVDQEAELRKQTEQQRTQEEIEKEMEKRRQEAMT